MSNEMENVMSNCKGADRSNDAAAAAFYLNWRSNVWTVFQSDIAKQKFQSNQTEKKPNDLKQVF